MYIGIDLGGSNLRVAGSESLLMPKLVSVVKKPISHYFESDFTLVLTSINQILHGDVVHGIGFATTGDVNKRQGVITSSENNPEWENKQIIEKLMQNYNCRVVIANDAEAAAMAEAKYGIGPDKDFVYISWGTGIGGAVVQENVVKQLDRDKYLANWEADCGGKNLSKKYGQLTKLDSAVWQEISERFVRYMVGVSQQLGVNTVILGGGMSLYQKAVLSKLNLYGVDLRFTKFGDESGLYGALAMLKA